MIRLTDIQILKLGKTLHHIKTNNFFYAQMFNDERITTYEALAKLPLLTYEMLAQGYPFAYSCADTRGLTYANTQKSDYGPVMNLFTDTDVFHIAEMTARTFSIAEITEDDTLLLISDEKTSPAFKTTSEKLRYFLINGSGSTHDELYQLILDTDTSCLLGDTSDIIDFVEHCRKKSYDLRETSIKKGIFSGKPLTNGTRKHIEKETGMDVFMTGGFNMFLHGMLTDCPEHDGMHIWDDHYIVEIVDENGKCLKDGEEGELVVTTLSLNALPLIRFKTGKKSKIISREKCMCGLHTVKIDYP